MCRIFGACIAGFVGACLGNCCSQMLCGNSKDSPNFRFAGLIYFLMMICSTVTAYITQYTFPHFKKLIDFKYSGYNACQQNQAINGVDELCVMNQSVYRVFFGLQVLLFLIAIICLIPASRPQRIYADYFLIKILLGIGFYIGVVFIPKWFMDLYAMASLYILIPYSFFQASFFVPMTYSFNDWIIKKAHGENAQIKLGMAFVFTLIVFLAQIIWQIVIITSSREALKYVLPSLILTVLSTLLALSKWIPHGAFLPSTLVGLLCASIAILLQKSSNAANTTTWGYTNVVATLLTFVTLSYILHIMNSQCKKTSIQDDFTSNKDDELNELDEKSADESQKSNKSVSNCNIRIIIVGLTLSVSKLLFITLYSSNIFHSTAIKVTLLIELYTLHVCYIWTLIAPLVLRNREFSDQ